MIRTLVGLWRVLDRHQRQVLVLLQVLSVIMGFCTIGGIAAVVPFFTVLADPSSISKVAMLEFLYQKFQFAGEREFVLALGVGFVLAVFGSNAVNLAGTIAMNRFAQWVGNEFHVRLFRSYLYRGYAFHAQNNSATLTSKVIHETGRVANGLIQSGLTLITSLIVIAFILVSMMVVNPVAALASVFGLGASYVLIYAFARRRLLESGRAHSRFAAERNQVVNESFGAIKEITVAQRQDVFVDRFARACRSISSAVADAFALSQSPRYVLESLAVGGLVGIALLLSGRGTGAGPWLAQLTFIGFATYRLLPALQQLFAALARIRADRAAFESIADDLLLAGVPLAATHVRQGDAAWRRRPRQQIRLLAVSFRYADDRAPAIRGVTLEIPSGALVCLVGPNGSGKTTLVDLIAGLLVPQSGSVEVDGCALDPSNLPDWQQNIAYVPQDVFLLDATLSENIALGVSPESVDRDRLLYAARLAQLDDLIAALPKGVEEPLGERGLRLSGGQRQRVGIARALYQDACVLIMDEPTRALDEAAQVEFLTLLRRLRGERTIILVTHRLGFLQHCDLVIEVQNGMITGQWAPGERSDPVDQLRTTARRAEWPLSGA